MNVVLTWSRKYSHEIALFLRDWLTDVMPTVKPWVSSEDIQKGKKWFQELMSQFKETSFSITCITAENVNSPWVYYEAGLIAAKQEASTMCPYLVGVAVKLIKDTPLGEFQCTEADRPDTWKLILSINTALGAEAYDNKALEATFNSQWPRLKAKLEKIVAKMGEIEGEVTQVHQPQRPELRPFTKQILLQALKDSRGCISHFHGVSGYSFTIAGRKADVSHDARELAKWNGAIEELQQNKLLQDKTGKRENFYLTDRGFELAEQLLADDPIGSLTDEARKILSDACKGDGLVFFGRHDGGFDILTSEGPLVPFGKPKEAANWKHGLDQLFERKFLEQTNDENSFRVTKRGYEASKELAG